MLTKLNVSQDDWSSIKLRRRELIVCAKKEIRHGAPVSAHLINQQRPRCPKAEGHGKKSNTEIMPVISFLPHYHDDGYQQSMFGPYTASTTGRLILIMCADSTRLLIDIMMYSLNLPGYIITY